MDRDKIFKISELCGFEVKEEVDKYNSPAHYGHRSRTIKKASGTFSAPEKDIFLEVINKPSRVGSIGRLVNMTISEYSSTPDAFFIAFDGRKNVLKFKHWDLELREKGPTVYNFIKKDPVKRDIKPITNKFGQTLEKGDLVVGIGGRYGYVEIVFGYVSRWTEAGTLFLKPYGPFGRITNKTEGDVKIKEAKQTIRLPKEAELEKDLFTCVLGADYK